jgi:hypothetical protein
MRSPIDSRLDDLVDVSAAGRHAGRSGGASFDADLRLVRRRVLRHWALALAARYALAALAIAVVPAALAAFGLIGWIWAIVVPAALFVGALGARLARPPSTAEVARLLDDRLGLFDVTATALQVERSGEPVDEGPAAPVFAEAAALLREGVGSWRPRSRLGLRELGVAVGLAVVLAVIVVLGTAGAGGSASGGATATVAPGGAQRNGHRMTNVSPPLAPPKAKRLHGRRGELPEGQRFARGLYAFGYEGKRKLPQIEGKRTGLYSRGGQESRGQQQQSFSAQSPGEANEAREKAEEEAAGAGAKQSGEKQRGGGEGSQSLKSLTGGKAPPSGSVSPLPNSSSGARPSTGGRPGGGPSNSGAGRRSAGAPSKQSGGSPAGGATAGGQRASLAGREKEGEGGKAGGELALKAGFAAVKSGKAATGHGPRDAQGAGGPGRSAGIAGSAFEEAEAGSLGYVPPDAGVAPTLDPGLFARYLNALARIAGRRW